MERQDLGKSPEGLVPSQSGSALHSISPSTIRFFQKIQEKVIQRFLITAIGRQSGHQQLKTGWMLTGSYKQTSAGYEFQGGVACCLVHVGLQLLICTSLNLAAQGSRQWATQKILSKQFVAH